MYFFIIILLLSEFITLYLYFYIYHIKASKHIIIIIPNPFQDQPLYYIKLYTI